VPTPVAVRSKAWVCSRTIAGTAGSNRAEDMEFVRCFCCVVCCAGSCLCDELITRSEEPYRVCVRVVRVCYVESSERDHLGPIWAVAVQEREIVYICVFIHHTYVGGLTGTSTVIAVS
jgi:hypothetical protein